MSELPGQLALFALPGELPQDGTTSTSTQELCDECGTACTGSKECVEISGLYDEEET